MIYKTHENKLKDHKTIMQYSNEHDSMGRKDDDFNLIYHLWS